MFRIRNKIPRNETMDKGKHGILNRANGIEMPTVTNRMLWGIDRMGLIGAHDPSKADVSSNQAGKIHPYSLVPGVSKTASKSHLDLQGSSIR